MCISKPSPRRIFIVGENLLFEESLAHLLTSEAGLQVSNQKYVDDPWLLDTILKDQPDVILLSESNILNSRHLLGSLFSTPLPLAGVQIIIIRLTDSLVDVYEVPKQIGRKMTYQQYNILNREEFVAIVEGDFEHIQNYNFPRASLKEFWF